MVLLFEILELVSFKLIKSNKRFSPCHPLPKSQTQTFSKKF